VCMEQESYYFTSPAFVGSSEARDQVGGLLVSCLTAAEGTTQADIQKLFKDAVDRCITLNK
ncbi:MAG: hypothetical protein J5912_05150, partial [Clostridia bacterium]|nr:hypothetical protein [Clostridia bacterium]